jgi:hypothetical protein
VRVVQRYEVMKMTKFNIKQERVLGIDRDRITNASKRKSGEPSGSVRPAFVGWTIFLLHGSSSSSSMFAIGM